MRVLSFWFDFASPYAYLSAMRIEAAAARAGVELDYRPFLLGVVMRERGWEKTLPETFPVKLQYIWRDIERQAAKYGLSFRRPDEFRRPVSAGRIGVLAAAEGWVAPFTRACYSAYFADGRDIGDPAVLAEVVSACGHDGAAVLARSEAPAIRQALRENTEQALARGLFGAPSFTIGEELYWGDDRLDDAIAYAAA